MLFILTIVMFLHYVQKRSLERRLATQYKYRVQKLRSQGRLNKLKYLNLLKTENKLF